MKACKFCGATMFSEHETSRMNNQSYTAFHTCPKCKAVCDEKVTVFRGGKKEVKSRWFNPTTKELEEWKDE